MTDPILLDVQLTGVDDVTQQAAAMGEALGQGFGRPSADVEKLNASIAALAATITKLGAASTQTAQQVQGVAAASSAFDALTDSVNQFQAAQNAAAEAAEKLGEQFTHLGQQSQQAGKHIHAMGEAGSAAASSLKLVQTSVSGIVEVLTGGGLGAGVSLIKEVGEGIASTGKHFGEVGEKIAKFVERGVLAAGVLGAVGISLKELADHSKEDTLEINALAEAMGVSVAEFVQTKSALSDLGIGMDQLAVTVRSVSVRMQNEWAGIQRAVRDATLPIVQDQLAIQAAMRATEEAQIGVREAAIATAEAEREVSEAQAAADRAAAEAQISASEAVINQKEAEFDAQNKLADAQRAYADAVVNANEAQLNLADAQKDFQYQGDDAWRTMKDAIDAVADAERKAADEANAVQEALLSVDEAATSVKGAYVSLYAAQIAYREAHGERVSRAERAELRREQTEVGLESAQERVRGAEFQAAKTQRDAVPEAIERRDRAERGVGAAKEAEDKAQQQYAESSQRAADKLEKAGSAAAAALEHVAKAALEVQLAPQRATNETAKAGLAVEDALANVRKTQFEATHALERAEDNLLSARLKEKAALDAIPASVAAATAAHNKYTDDLNSNINAVRQYITTGRGPAGFDIRQTPPSVVAQAAEFQAGGPGHMRQEVDLLQKAFQNLRIPMQQWESVMMAAGFPRSVLTTGAGGTEFREAFDPANRGTSRGRPIATLPTTAQEQEAKDYESRLKNARELDLAEKRVISAYNKLADQYGAAVIPEAIGTAHFTAEHPIGAAATAVAIVGFTAGVDKIAGTTAEWGLKIVEAILLAKVGGGVANLVRGLLFGKGGAAASTEGMVIEGGFSKGPQWPTPEEARAHAAGESAVEKALEPKPTAPVEPVKPVAPVEPIAPPVTGTFASGLADIVSKAFLPVTAAIQLLQGEAAGLKAVKQVQEKAATERGEKPLTADELVAALKKEAGITPEEKKPEPKPEPKAEEKPEEKKAATTNLDAAAKRLDEAGVKLIDAAKALTGDKSVTKGGASISDVAAKLEEIVTKLSAAPAGGETGSKLDDAAGKLDHAADKLDDAAGKIGKGGGGGDAADLKAAGDKIGAAADHLGDLATKLGGGPLGGPEVRMQEQGADAINSIKESIDKLVGEKGVLQPPTDPKERSAYDEAVVKLINSLTEINEAQKGLIEAQTEATKEGEILTKAQEKLVEAQTDLVRAQTSAVGKGGGGGVSAGGGGGVAAAGGGGGGAAAGGGGGGGGGVSAPSGGGGAAYSGGATGGGAAYSGGATGGGAGGGRSVVYADQPNQRGRVSAPLPRESGEPHPRPGPPELDVQGKPLIPGVRYYREPDGIRAAPPEAQSDAFAASAARAAQSNIIKSVDEVPYGPPDTAADTARAAARQKRFEKAKRTRPLSDWGVWPDGVPPKAPPTLEEMYPGGHPPLSLDSPLRERGGPPHVPRHDVTTTLPNFDTIVTKLTSSASKEESAADKLSVAADKLATSETTTQKASTHAAGGLINAPGISGDNVPIMATSGEFIVNAPATSKNRSLLESINSGEELHFALGGAVPNVMGMIAAQGGTEPSGGAISRMLTSNIGMGPGGYMMAKMQAQKNQSYEVDLRTDHGTYAVLATEDQMGSMLQGSIAARIASTGSKPSWWS